VYKNTMRYESPIPRRLCLSGYHLAELDADTNGLVSVRHMATVFAVVSDPGEQQWLTIEFMDGSTLHYMSKKREALIACLLDACESAGNYSVLHRLQETRPDHLYGPKWTLLETSFENNYFHANIQGSKSDDSLLQILSTFSLQNLRDNPMTAITLEKILGMRLLLKCNEPECVNIVIATLQAMQLLLQQNHGFAGFAQAMEANDGAEQLAACITADDEDMQFQTVLVIMRASLLAPASLEFLNTPGVEELDPRSIRTRVFSEGRKKGKDADPVAKITPEQIRLAGKTNKIVMMENGQLRKGLSTALLQALQSQSGHLLVKGIVSLMDIYLLPPHVEDTATPHYNAMLFSLGALQGQLFQLFFHPSIAVMKTASKLMEAITRDSTAEQAAEMQRTALKEGAFLKHLYTAIYSQAVEARLLSRRLVSMWADNNEEAIDTLRQMFPRGILHFLIRALEPDDAAAEDDGAGGEGSGPRSRAEVMALKQEKKEMLKRQQDSAAGVEDPGGDDTEYTNWAVFWETLPQDFHRGDLMWNDTTREELRHAMEAEISALGLDEQGAVRAEAVSWNHRNFEVIYHSLLAEPMIGNLYLHRLLERRTRDENVNERLLAEVARDGNPERFFGWAFERFLLSQDDDTKAVCLQVMTIVYRAHHAKLPVFRAMRDVVAMIDFTFSKKVRDNLLMFIEALLYEPLNAKSFMNANGVELVTELMTLVHWDASLKIAAAGLEESVMMLEDAADHEKEPATYWFYKVPKGFDDAGQEVGPLSMTSLEKLWPSGVISGGTLMHTKDDWQWKPLKTIRCLRWRFMMTGQSKFTPVEVAIACVDIMLMLCGMFPITDEYGLMMKPLPRARVLLSDMKTVLPHLVQLFITQHPKLIEKASILIKMIADQNDELVRKLYRTGLFCFAFMYQGSNVLPLVSLVKETHARQQFQGFEDALMMSETNVVKQSILSTIFPDSLVLYLHHRSPYDFVKTYLGEHDTPELIWTMGMRDSLMKELAQHTSDFAWQLREFPMSVYDYEPVPAIAFPELREEIWLHTCYLKNLADAARFPMWQIDEPVEFLRALLTFWTSLLKADPDATDDASAYKLLDCDPSADQATLKKRYRKAALKYHPDKVRKTPSWPRSWANFNLLQLYSHRNTWANLQLLGQPNTLHAQEPRRPRHVPEGQQGVRAPHEEQRGRRGPQPGARRE
jgi:DnaJ family protein C protein 13